MNPHDNVAPRATAQNLTHAFTDPNPFLSEDRTILVGGRATAMQRGLNTTPERTED
ncbi:hypothetical protein ACFO3K_04420 [Cellulomonas algicola]|uniref:Uncharacterized protein n=1 Tax=Cellulomonas algicola TaxID=2071633 RepID=A0A401V3B2_9CELL|nr:hypothetical protein [Cellulomonas algicola]GCD21398.1 hypothetical protein CTKZ_29600 [Cellulomonas algicola]